MAEVYLGTDERLGRQVAVKLLNTSMAGESEFRSRFRQEAQAAARMTHPTIVRVFDAGEDTFIRADGHELVVPYIVMEYIEGQQLRDVLADGPLPIDRVERYMSGLLTALEYSHRAGIVHRDIKPGNIMVTPDDTVKVMDFGIARAISDTAGTIAQTTAILGTASYFSPEQAKGETVDGRSDIYSAGIVLYEMLTGRVPFYGDSAVAVAYQHVTERPALPSSLNANVSKAMDAVVMRALAKNRDDRYQSASEFRRDLEQAAQGVMPAFAANADDLDDTQLFGPAPTAVQKTEASFAALENPSDDRAPQVSRRPPAMWLWGAGVVVLAIAVAIVIWVSNLPKEGVIKASVQVPDFAGQTWEQASASLTELGLVPDRKPQESDQVPANQIISTDPPAGVTVAPGTRVTVVVSSGLQPIKLADVRGLSLDQAKAQLEQAGLVVGTVSQKDSPTVPQNAVISSDPASNTQVAKGSTVNLVVSTGQVQLPDLRGTTLDAATSTLRDLGLIAVVTGDVTCPATDGEPIINMSVAPGSVPQRSNVTITRCTGAPAPTQQPTTPPTNGGGSGGDSTPQPTP